MESPCSICRDHIVDLDPGMGSFPAVRCLSIYDFKMGSGPCDWRDRGWSRGICRAKVGPRPWENDSLSCHRRKGADNGRNKTSGETGYNWNANQAPGTNHRLRIARRSGNLVQDPNGDGECVAPESGHYSRNP